MKIALTTFFLVFQIILFAQEPVLITDLNPGPEDGFSTGVRAKTVTINNTTLFIVKTEETGLEIGYLKDGEVQVLKDIYPGPTSSFPRDLTVFNNHFYFSARTSNSSGYQLWKSDGTPEGTQMFSDEGNDTNGLVISKSNFLYYFNGNTIFRTDGISIDSVFSGASYSVSFQPTDVNICPYNEEIAFMTKVSGNALELYIVEDGVPTLKGTRPAGSSFPKIFGMNQVGENILFIVDDSFNDELSGSFIYNSTTETISPYKINGLDIVRMHNFTDELAFAHERTTGFYAVNGIPGEEVLLVDEVNVTYAQGSEIPRVVYQDKMVLATKPEFFGMYPIQITDGTDAGTNDVYIGRSAPPVSILLEGRFAFFIYEFDFNDFRIGYINMGDGTSGSIYEFIDADFQFNAFPVALQNEKLFFAAQIDDNIGMELYSVDFNLDVVATDQPEPLSYSVAFTDKSFTVSSDNYSSAQVEIYSASGALLETMNADTNAPNSLEHHTGLIILRFNVNGEITTRKFLRM